MKVYNASIYFKTNHTENGDYWERIITASLEESGLTVSEVHIEHVDDEPQRKEFMTYKGELDIDVKRGVIWFNQDQIEGQQPCLLRICRLGQIPKDVVHIDVTHMVGVSFERKGEQ
jgi:hypothetical protein